jgi:chromosome segregation ATPase
VRRGSQVSRNCEQLVNLQVEELEECFADLSEELQSFKTQAEAAQRSAGDAADERAAALHAQVEELQYARGEAEAEVHSMEQQLKEQDRRYREVRRMCIWMCCRSLFA